MVADRGQVVLRNTGLVDRRTIGRALARAGA
jgi:hypothetical protein